MPAPDPAELQADALALTVAVHHNDVDAIRTVLEPYMTGGASQGALTAGLLTTLARMLGETYTQIGAYEGVDFDTVVQVAGRLGAQRRTSPPALRCSVCGSTVELADPDDPESHVHAEDGDWDDHTAQVN